MYKVSRPCKRCTALGKCDTCIDIKHKKRGRPKLTANIEKTNNVSPVPIPAVPLAANTFVSLLPMAAPVSSACSFNMTLDKNKFAADTLPQSEMMTVSCSFHTHVLFYNNNDKNRYSFPWTCAALAFQMNPSNSYI